jgi:hypothetical protein
MTAWTIELPSVLTTGRLTTSAAPAASDHVGRARLARQARAARVKAAADPHGDAERVLAYVYAATPVTIMRPGALAYHCGLTEDRAAAVLTELVERGFLAEGATPVRASVIGPQLAGHVMRGESLGTDPEPFGVAARAVS